MDFIRRRRACKAFRSSVNLDLDWGWKKVTAEKSKSEDGWWIVTATIANRYKEWETETASFFFHPKSKSLVGHFKDDSRIISLNKP
jgi:hypothetical protein